MEHQEQVTLLTEDGEQLNTSMSAALGIGIIEPMLRLCMKSSTTSSLMSKPIPVPSIKSPVMRKVLEFLEHHTELWNVSLEQDTAIVNEATDDSFSKEYNYDDDDDDELSAISSAVSNPNLTSTTGPTSKKLSTLSSAQQQKEELFAEYLTLTSPWDQKFASDMDLPTLIEVTKAANFLNIPSLLDLCCRSIAREMSGLSIPELRAKFNLPNDFTPDEEARMALEFAWIDN